MEELKNDFEEALEEVDKAKYHLMFALNYYWRYNCLSYYEYDLSMCKRASAKALDIVRVAMSRALAITFESPETLSRGALMFGTHVMNAATEMAAMIFEEEKFLNDSHQVLSSNSEVDEETSSFSLLFENLFHI